MPATPLTLHHGSCLDVLPIIPDASVDSIVTDPPYELGFMGKQWDASGIAYNVMLWYECLRALKPGGHLLAFGGTRTYHRMACAIEDAGFEIRDSINWLYGSGFPKSLDVSKAIDKQRHDLNDIYKVTAWVRSARDAAGITNKDIDAAFGTNGMAGHWTSSKSQPAVPTLDQVPTLLDVLGVNVDDVPADIRRLLWDLNGKKGQPGENWAKREVVGIASVPAGHAFAGPVYGGDSSSVEVTVTAPATDAAKQWHGWGTALKPAHEPIVVARKPLVGTVAANVLEHGTGALNIDECRVGNEGGGTRCDNRDDAGKCLGHDNAGRSTSGQTVHGAERSGGRWPANVVIDEAIADAHPEWGRFFYCPKPDRGERDMGLGALPVTKRDIGDDRPSGGSWERRDGRTSAATTNFHPTVKPVDLMRWLVRLVTPPNGTVLDPFAGSGTTLVAARLEGFAAIGIEMTADYLPIIEGRLQWAQEQAVQLSLFGEGGTAA